MFFKSTKFIYLLVFGLYFLITIILFNHRFLNIQNYYPLPGVDTDGTLWQIFMSHYAKQENILFEHGFFMNYPYSYDNRYIPYFSLIYEIYKLFLSSPDKTNIVLVTNIFTLSAYALTAFFNFILINKIIKNKLVAFTSSLIFAFSYYFVLMGRGSLAQNHLEFVPIYYLTLVNFLEKPSYKNILISALVISITFMANAYWAFFCLLFSPIILFLNLKEKKIKWFVYYFIFTISILVLTNLSFINTQLYNFDKSTLAASGKVFVPRKQVVDLINFFIPPKESLIYPIKSESDVFIGYVALILIMINFFTFKKKEVFLISIQICFLLSIILASYIDGLFFINKIYFEFFGMFRSVSRLNVFSSFFASIIASYTLLNLFEYLKLNYKRPLIIFSVFTLLSCLIVIESLNDSPSWKKLTNFPKLVQIHTPVRENPEIKNIVAYPLYLSNGSNGVLPHIQVLGQIVHRKNLVGAASPFQLESLNFFQNIKNIENPYTIEYLRKVGVDTIMIYELDEKYQKIVQKLKEDSRLLFMDTYTADSSKDKIVISGGKEHIWFVDKLEKIHLFKIKNPEVLTIDSLLKLESTPQEVKLRYTQTDANTVDLQIIIPQKSFEKVSKENFNLVFNMPYTSNWRIYNQNLSNPFLKPSGYLSENQFRYNQVVNAWKFDIQNLILNNCDCYTNNDRGDFIFNLRLKYYPNFLNDFLNFISVLVIGIVSLYIFFQKDKIVTN